MPSQGLGAAGMPPCTGDAVHAERGGEWSRLSCGVRAAAVQLGGALAAAEHSEVCGATACAAGLDWEGMKI